jgi:hypothetical protein
LKNCSWKIPFHSKNKNVRLDIVGTDSSSGKEDTVQLAVISPEAHVRWGKAATGEKNVDLDTLEEEAPDVATFYKDRKKSELNKKGRSWTRRQVDELWKWMDAMVPSLERKGELVDGAKGLSGWYINKSNWPIDPDTHKMERLQEFNEGQDVWLDANTVKERLTWEDTGITKAAEREEYVKAKIISRNISNGTFDVETCILDQGQDVQSNTPGKKFVLAELEVYSYEDGHPRIREFETKEVEAKFVEPRVRGQSGSR